MLKKDDPDKQLVYYQAGIGTYTTPEIATPFMSSISKVSRELTKFRNLGSWFSVFGYGGSLEFGLSHNGYAEPAINNSFP